MSIYDINNPFTSSSIKVNKEYAVVICQSNIETKYCDKDDIFQCSHATSSGLTTRAGQMNTKSACYRDLRVQVNTSYCNPRSKPATGLMPCNSQPCPARSDPFMFSTHPLFLSSNQWFVCLPATVCSGLVLVSAQRVVLHFTASDSPNPEKYGLLITIDLFHT